SVFSLRRTVPTRTESNSLVGSLAPEPVGGWDTSIPIWTCHGRFRGPNPKQSAQVQTSCSTLSADGTLHRQDLRHHRPETRRSTLDSPARLQFGSIERAHRSGPRTLLGPLERARRALEPGGIGESGTRVAADVETVHLTSSLRIGT